MEIYEYIYQREHLQPFALAKISIATTDVAGLDLNRQTITGDHDLLFKKLIEMNEGKSIPEEEYFPAYVKAYMDHGATLLEQEYKYTNDIYTHLMELEKGI